MNRETYYSYIEEKLSVLALRIEKRGRLNVLNYHIHSENFYRDFLNLLYGWNLKNLNENRQNVEGIDLIDDKNKFIVQVSATNTKNKIETSLGKSMLKDYKNYTFKFISIARTADKLKEKDYHNPYNLQFNPQEDIYDSDTLLKAINGLKIGEMENIYTFIKKELDTTGTFQKLPSELTAIINVLAKENLTIVNMDENLNIFEIEKKIQFNKLDSSRLLIEDHKIYYSTVENIYSSHDKMGQNKSLAVLNVFRKEYIENKQNYTGDVLYKIISQKIMEKIKHSDSVDFMSEEELELCVDILMVDAFIRCKIFENPNNYAYVVTR